MDFSDFRLPKINDCNSHVSSIAPATSASILSSSYGSTIDKNALQSLSFHDMQNADSPPPAMDGKDSEMHVPVIGFPNLNKGDGEQSSQVLQENQDTNEAVNNGQDSEGNKNNAAGAEERHLCQYCDRVYPSRTNLSRHIFRVHRIPKKKQPNNSLLDDFQGAICYEEGCNNKKFKSTTELRNHLVNEHNFIFQVVKNQLETEQQFIQWKKNVEEACNIKWVKQAAKKKATGNVVVTYICHRSGRFRQNPNKKRALKSCKIGHFCTAYLKVTIFDPPNEDGKKYSVELYPDHYGHDVASTEEKKVKIQVAKCLTNPVRGVLVGTTGVLFENGKYEAIKGSVVAIDKLRQLGITIRFITNDSRRTPADLVKKLESLGFTVFEEEIISPIPVVINTLLTLGLRPYLMVHPDIRPAFEKIDQSSPNCVVIGDMGNNLSAEMFNDAYQVLISSPSPVLVKLGNEKYYKEKTSLVLGAASYAAALEYACSTEAMVVGKPCYDYIMNAVHGMGICPQEVIMVGDDLENDIQAAQRCGMRAIMVRTGKFRPDDAKNEVIKPDTIVKNLAHLVDMLVLKTKREKNPQESPPKFSKSKQKQIDRTHQPMEQHIPPPVPVPVPVPVPLQVHCDGFPFQFGPRPDGP